MRKKIGLVFLTILLVIAVIFVGCGKKETAQSNDKKEPVKIKLGHQMTPESPEGKAYQHFADLVKEKSKGEIEIVVYPTEQLGDSKAQIESTMLGTQDIVATGASLFSRFDSIFNISTIPFLFKDNSYFSQMMQGDIGKQQQEILKKNGLVLLNEARNMMRGPYRVLVSKKPVRSPEDVKGLRFRTYENKIYMTTWETLGANPIVIPWGEAYMALMQNTVDAVTGPMVQLYDMKFTEVAPYVTIINEYTSDVVWAINKKKFDSLSSDQQKLLIECANEAGTYLSEIEKPSIKENTEKMIKEHGAEFIEIDTTPFREALTDFYKQLEADGKIPKGILEKALK